MVVLSPRFALLACLCVALPLALPHPVEAAHIHGSHPVEKHASSPHSHQRARARDHSFFGWPAAAYRDDGKNNGHQGPDRRAPELPPLLRRDRVHNHNEVHNQHGQGPHDDAHHKLPRSVFARSRYRREPVYFSRRSSVYVSGEHGNTYLVSRAPPRNWGHRNTGEDKRPSHPYNRRQVDESNLVLGTIDIMSAAQSPSSAQRLGSLLFGKFDGGPAEAFTLSASTTNQTQFIMMPTDETSNAAGSSKHVALAVEVFDPSRAEMVMYCAAYDPDPAATSALLMTPCTSAGVTQPVTPADDAADPCASDGNDAPSSNSHESQIFTYDPSSGQISPLTSATASSSSTGNSSDDPAPCAGTRVRRDGGNSTTSGSVRPSGTSTSTAPTTSASQQARNVTLVFVADALAVPASSSSSSNTNTATTTIGQASVLTKTITTTVIASVTASGSSTLTVTPAQAAASVPTSSIPSRSTSIAAPSAFTTATAARSSLSLLSSASTTATPSADESFEIEIVGIAPSTTASSSSMSTTASTTTATTATSSYGSSSVSMTRDPLAVASSIANAMVSARASVYASKYATKFRVD